MGPGEAFPPFFLTRGVEGGKALGQGLFWDFRSKGGVLRETEAAGAGSWLREAGFGPVFKVTEGQEQFMEIWGGLLSAQLSLSRTRQWGLHRAEKDPPHSTTTTDVSVSIIRVICARPTVRQDLGVSSRFLPPALVMDVGTQARGGARPQGCGGLWGAHGFPGEPDRPGLRPPGALSERLVQEVTPSHVNRGSTRTWHSGGASWRKRHPGAA